MTSGLVFIDKPSGWTSHDIVAKLRGIAGTRRVGHAGTLDPMATGLLVLGIDAGTKLLTFLVGADKTYEARIRLGASTITDDAEGEITSTADASAISGAQIELALEDLRGEIMQVPSSVSAIKVDGERAYAKVRGGDEVKLAPRPITIHRFEITSAPVVVDGFLDFDAIIECSSGTYVRALARDLGAALKVGGHLTALRRTRVGDYLVEDALSMETLTRENLKVTPLLDSALANFEKFDLTEQQEIDLRHGKKIDGSIGSEIASAVRGDKLVAMIESAGSKLKSAVVFAEEK
ncbi:MAG: tRNA pseudouridine(55) synthase TruB [Actinomycetota bacterium]